MRVAAAYLSDDYHAVVETSRRLVWLLRSDVDFRLSSAPESITGDYLVARATRIQSISTGLNLVRESGRIAAYKFVDLDNQIEKLMQLFQQIAEGGVAGGQQGQ
jgi:hypothetical protein